MYKIEDMLCAVDGSQACHIPSFKGFILSLWNHQSLFNLLLINIDVEGYLETCDNIEPCALLSSLVAYNFITILESF